MIPSWVIDPTPAEIRKRFDVMVESWKSIRDEAKIDMRYCTGDPWDEVERKSRTGMGRLCLDFDELTQYINQLINGLRQNKRAPKVTPRGNGANDKTAEVLAGMLKAIGYKSNAQAARITAAESMAMRSYGYTKIVREYVSDDSDLQELRIRRIPNPDVIYLDPDAREVDFSDMADAFELDRISREEFQRRFPKANPLNFTSEEMAIAPQWIQEEQIQIANYWRAHERKRRLLRLDSQDEPEVYEDELPEGSGIEKSTNYLERKGMKSVRVRAERERKERFVMCYLTNGLQILESAPWTLTVTNPTTGKKTTGCTSIPIIPYFGKELWVDKGSGSQRVIHSLIRMARTPYMTYCYTCTAQLEEIQMTSKSPYFAVEGQFENHEQEAKTLNRLPRAYQEYKAVTEATGNTILPPPTRPNYIPNVELLEVFAQSCRAKIADAIGINNPRQQKQSTRPLSGKALDELEAQADRSTFHFVDNYDRALEREAAILMEAIPVVYDTVREVSISGVDEKQQVVTLNDPAAIDPKTKQPLHVPTDEGDFDVTLSVGPSFDSEREQANDFSDRLVDNQAIVNMALQNPQSTAAKLLGQAIRLKDLGPIGDGMAEAIDPSENGPQIPPQVQAQVQKMQSELQQAVAMVGKLQFELKNEGELAILEMKNKRLISAETNRSNIIIEMLKMGKEGAENQFLAETARIEADLDRAFQLSMAQTPPPIDPNQQMQAQQEEPQESPV